jgi:hypothetical protein
MMLKKERQVFQNENLRYSEEDNKMVTNFQLAELNKYLFSDSKYLGKEKLFTRIHQEDPLEAFRYFFLILKGK